MPIASCTLATGAEEVYRRVHRAIEELKLDAEVYRAWCTGLCFMDPWIGVAKEGQPPALYGNVKPDQVPQILRRYLEGDLSGAIAVRFKTGTRDPPLLDELDFWRLQTRYVSRNCGLIDPESIEDYVETGEHSGLKSFEYE